MIESIEFLTYRQHRIVLSLTNPWIEGVAVKSVDGLSATKASINTTELALTDVAIFNGARAGMRNLKLKLAPLSYPDIETTRQRIYSWFQIKQPMSVYINTDKRRVRTEGYVESVEADIFSKDEEINVSILCPDAYWHDADTMVNQNLEWKRDIGTFEFDFMDEPSPSLEFATDRGVLSAVIDYKGEVETGFTMIFRFRPGAKLPITVTETFSRDTFKLTGAFLDKTYYKVDPIVGGDVITVNSRVGSKYIIRTRGDRKDKFLAALDRNSDWLKLRPGVNEFQIAMNDPTLTDVYFSTDVLYQGV